LSILNTTASPSPIEMTPAFSPGPWITQGASVGSVRRWIFEDLYEQCSFHMAEKMPSSVSVGSRPINLRMRSYSSGVRPCSATRSGVIFGSLGIIGALVVQRPTGPSSPRFPLGDADPLSLPPARMLGRALELPHHVGKQAARLVDAAHHFEQQRLAHARLRARIIGGQSLILRECLLGSAAGFERPCVQQVSLAGFVLGPVP